MVEQINATVITCDVCGRIIEKRKEVGGKIVEIEGANFVERYHLLTGYHNSNGEEFPDNEEGYDLCSKECVRKKLEEFLEASGTANEIEYFELERENDWTEKRV